MLVDKLELSADEEGVFRVLELDPEQIISFTCRDFGRFLTEFVAALNAEEIFDEEEPCDD